MSPTTKNQLTTEQIHDAVALINECLLDQKEKSEPVYSNSHDALKHQVSNTFTTEHSFCTKQYDVFSSEIHGPLQEKLNYSLHERRHHSGDMQADQVCDLNMVKFPTIGLLLPTCIPLSNNPHTILDNTLADLMNESQFSSNATSNQIKTTNDNKMQIGLSKENVLTISTQATSRNMSNGDADGDSDIKESALNMSPKSDYGLNPPTDRYVAPNKMSLHSNHDFFDSETTDFDSFKPFALSGASDEVCLISVKEEGLNEDEEDRIMSEEIEKTKKRLLWLEDQRRKMKKQKMRKRHSLGDTHDKFHFPAEGTKHHVTTSATLPRHPEYSTESVQHQNDLFNQQSEFGANGQPYLKSTTEAFTTPTQKQSNRRSPGSEVADPRVVKRADIFTPAYAHPMLQPRHIINHRNRNSRQIQEKEQRKRREDDTRKLEEQKEAKKQKRKTQDNLHQDRKINEKNQEKFSDKSIENEKHGIGVAQKQYKKEANEIQKQINFEEPMKGSFQQVVTKKRQQQLPQKKQNLQKQRDFMSITNLKSMGDLNGVRQINKVDPHTSMTLPSPQRTKSITASAQTNPRPLRTELDELDLYIAQLSQTLECSEGECAKDDDVFYPSGILKSFHRHPLNQEALNFPRLKERLSPQLIFSMSLNPRAKPLEEIYSSKEDLDPHSKVDVVDSALPATPEFPVFPTTPYTNDSPSTSDTSTPPVPMARTPLSVLDLKPRSHLRPIINDIILDFNNGRTRISSASAQQSFNVNSSTKATSQLRLEKQELPAFYNENEPNNNFEEQRYEGIQSPTKLVIKSRSHDSGYAENHQPNHLSNGWVHHSPSSAELSNSCSSSNEQSHDMIKSPWIYPKNCSFKGIPSNSSARSSFALHSGSEEGSLNTPQSPTGSKDSLLSDESSTHLPHLAYQQQRINRSHPSFSSNESFSRLSRSSIRSTSTGSSQFYHNRSSDDGQRQMYPSSEWNSSSSLADIDKLAHQLAESSLCCTSTPKFIKDTTSYWYKPDITREQAMAMLRTKPEGSFVVRDSRCYPGGFGLAVKVHQVSQSVLTTSKPRSDTELVRHFLIEPNSKGVKLKGCVNEPVFGSLSSLICQHSITPMALPCKLIIPTENQEIPSPAGEDRNCVEVSNSTAELLRLGAACNVLYLGSADTESLTGPEAIERAMRECKQNQSDPKKTSVVHFKVSPQGITLTDQARRIFFRRHYPTLTITYCGMDPSASKPKNRRWDASSHHGPPDARVFGFVAKKYGGSIDNKCHLFAELDLDQPAPAIVNFVSKVLIASK